MFFLILKNMGSTISQPIYNLSNTMLRKLGYTSTQKVDWDAHLLTDDNKNWIKEIDGFVMVKRETNNYNYGAKYLFDQFHVPHLKTFELSFNENANSSEIHEHVLKFAQKNNWKYVCVIEESVSIENMNGFLRSIKESWCHLKGDFDILSFSADPVIAESVGIPSNLRKLVKSHGNEKDYLFYIMNRNYYQKMTELFEKSKKLDKNFQELAVDFQGKDKWYCFYPLIVSTK
jgi:hypothetical protein